MKILLKNCGNCNHSVELSGDEKKVLEVVIYFQFQAILTNVLHISWQSYYTFQSQMISKCLLIHFQGISSNSDKRFAHFMTEQLQISIVDDFQVS